MRAWTNWLSRFALLALITAGVISCSAEARQKAAEFFFEIPQSQPTSAPDDLQPSQMSIPPTRGVAAGTPFVSVHEPVARRRCSACHDGAADQSLAKPWTEKCASCHQDIVRHREYMHGPVGAMACKQCHLPHASALPSLLRQRDPDLCTVCHGDTLSRQPPFHDDPNRACTTCHDPHGSDFRYLLKSDSEWRSYLSTTAPASQPDHEDRR